MTLISPKYTTSQSLSRMKKWCDRKEHTHWEARNKLIEWGINYSDREAIIAELIEKNFINEQRYAGAFVSDKFRFNKWGVRKIVLMLKQKGVSERNIATALKSLGPEEYESTIHELLEKKLNQLKTKSLVEQKLKAARYAIGKGFEPENVWRLVDSITRSRK